MSDTASEHESVSLAPSKKRPSSAVDEVANKRSAFQITRKPGKIINLSRSSSIPSDVEIDVLGDVYHLHSSILCNASKFFDCSLSKVWYKPYNAHAGEDGIKFRYSLVLSAEDDYVGCFEPIPPSTRTAPDAEDPVINSSPESSPPPGSSEDDSPDTTLDAPDLEEEIKLIYATIFGTFYHHSFGSCFDEDEQALATTTRIIRIIETAEFLSCLQTIRDSVEAFLLRWCCRPVRERTRYNTTRSGGYREFKLKVQELRISSRVQELLPIAIKLRSEELYHDCFVHFVGMLQWADEMNHHAHVFTDQLVDKLEDVLLQLPTSTAKAIMKERRELQKHVNGAFNTYLQVFADDAYGDWRDGTDRFNLIMFYPDYSSTEKFRQLIADKNAGMYHLFDSELLPVSESDFLLETFHELSISRLEHAGSHVYRHFVCAKAPKELPWDVSTE